MATIRCSLIVSSLVALISAIIVYSDVRTLNGSMVYDDVGTVKSNDQVKPTAPWQNVFKYDYWGHDEFTSPASHKSFRPITTLTFRWNYAYSELEPFAYHCVNVALHGIVSALAVFVSAQLFVSVLPCLLTGLLFALHPVHTEAVSNISGRAELLMSLFYLLGALAHAFQRHRAPDTTQSLWHHAAWAAGVTTPVVLLFAALSLFSKEQGMTLPITCALYDLHASGLTVSRVLRALVLWMRRQAHCDRSVAVYLVRSCVLGVGTVLLALFRHSLNGGSPPELIYDQNPMAFADAFFTRVMSKGWIYTLYLATLVYPAVLCCDWSGRSIPLVESISDWRAGVVVALYASIVMGLVVTSLDLGASLQRHAIAQQAFVGWMLLPFLLSADILVDTGFALAERVAYLPSLGFCMLTAYALSEALPRPAVTSSMACATKRTELVEPHGAVGEEIGPEDAETELTTDAEAESHAESPSRNYKVEDDALRNEGAAVCVCPAKYDEEFVCFGSFRRDEVRLLWPMLVSLLLVLYARRTVDRNFEWSNGFYLWSAAREANPRSYHTMYNFGLELSWKGKSEEAAKMLEMAHNGQPEDLSNHFTLALAYRITGRCDKALKLVDHGYSVLRKKQEAVARGDAVRSLRQDDKRVESNFLAVRGLCSDDVGVMGKLLYDAVHMDPTNPYAREEADKLLKRIQEHELLKSHSAAGLLPQNPNIPTPEVLPTDVCTG